MNKRALFFVILFLATGGPGAALAQEELIYVAVEPCRIADTRQSAEGVINADTFRNFKVAGSSGDLAVQGGTTDCPNPKGGKRPVAVAAYILAIPAESSTDKGVLTAYPSNQNPPPPGAGSTVNFEKGQTIGNSTIATICDSDNCPSSGELAVLARKTDEHVVIDVQGYFYSPTLLPGYEVRQAPFAVANSNGFTAETNCSPGKKALGGGGTLADGTWFLSGSHPLQDGSGWRVRYQTSGQSFSAAGAIWVVCASVN